LPTIIKWSNRKVKHLQAIGLMNGSAETIASPCIKQCNLDTHNICLGCFRSIAEITSWSQADAQTRRQVLAKAKIRSQQKLVAVGETCHLATDEGQCRLPNSKMAYPVLTQLAPLRNINLLIYLTENYNNNA